MSNKLYEKIFNFIKNWYKVIIIYIVVIGICLIKLPIKLYMGGGVIDLGSRVDISNSYQEKGSFNMAYVREVDATIPLYLFSYISGWERESIEKSKIDANDNVEDIWSRQVLYLEESIANATLNAFKEASVEYTINKEIYRVLYIDGNTKTDLKVNDEILAIEDNSVENYSDITNSVVNKEIGDLIRIKVKRNKEIIECYAKINELNGEKKIGVFLIKLYDYALSRDVKIDFTDREGGSSGGLMLSLAIYNKLTSNDLTKGKVIAGTGTIDENGNIGEIGGVKYKLMGANKAKADIFFVPTKNYDEAIKFSKKKGYKMKIVKVETFNEAINYLESR